MFYGVSVLLGTKIQSVNERRYISAFKGLRGIGTTVEEVLPAQPC